MNNDVRRVSSPASTPVSDPSPAPLASERVVSGADLRAAVVGIVTHAKQFVVLASPYLDLEGWEELLGELGFAIRRGVEVHVITRQPGGSSADEREQRAQTDLLARLGVRVADVYRLHAKVYLNESTVLLTSLNLLGSSRYSIDVGLVTRSSAARSSALELLSAHVPALAGLRSEESTATQRDRECAAPRAGRLIDRRAPDAVPMVVDPPMAVQRSGESCGTCGDVSRRESASPCAVCSEWRDRTTPDVLRLAVKLAAVAREAAGRDLHLTSRRHYLGLRVPGDGTYTFRLVPRESAVEVRLVVAFPEYWTRQFLALGVPAARDDRGVSLTLDAPTAAEYVEKLTALFEEAMIPSR